MGTNLNVPGFNFVELDAYARKDNFNSLTWQVTIAWELPFGDFPVSLAGYVDINGTDTHGTEINGQPQLLFDAGSMLGLPQHHLQVGMEWYFHHHNQLSSGVPQAMVKWVF